MHPYRFHIPNLASQHPPLQPHDSLPLPPDQAHHARAVLRLQPGEPILLFDGAGTWASATLDQLSKSAAHAKLTSLLTTDPPSPIQLILATAVPKADRADWLIEQASQLNVAAVQWLNCDRGIVKPRENGGKMEKWRRLAIESAKQCRRTHTLQIQDIIDLKTLLSQTPPQTKILWLNPNPAAPSIPQTLHNFTAGNILALIGPEGGWSDPEQSLLHSHPHIHQVRLTPTILRIETACAATAAQITTK